MPKLAILATALALIAAPLPALAQASESDERLCASREDPDNIIIAACTRVIDHGRLDDARLGNAYRYRAGSYAFMGAYREALADLDRAAELRPFDPAVLTDRSGVHRKLGDPARAIADLDAALKMRPDSLLALQWRGDAYVAAGKLERAIEDYGTVIAIDASFSPAWNGRCNARARLGRLEAAMVDCNEMVARAPHNAFGYD
ncbi:MAG: tetratricopeptide repeat protein, partial [Reyranellaceae bacterium]